MVDILPLGTMLATEISLFTTLVSLFNMLTHQFKYIFPTVSLFPLEMRLKKRFELKKVGNIHAYIIFFRNRIETFISLQMEHSSQIHVFFFLFFFFFFFFFFFAFWCINMYFVGDCTSTTNKAEL